MHTKFAATSVSLKVHHNLITYNLRPHSSVKGHNLYDVNIVNLHRLQTLVNVG